MKLTFHQSPISNKESRLIYRLGKPKEAYQLRRSEKRPSKKAAQRKKLGAEVTRELTEKPTAQASKKLVRKGLKSLKKKYGLKGFRWEKTMEILDQIPKIEQALNMLGSSEIEALKQVRIYINPKSVGKTLISIKGRTYIPIDHRKSPRSIAKDIKKAVKTLQKTSQKPTAKPEPVAKPAPKAAEAEKAEMIASEIRKSWTWAIEGADPERKIRKTLDAFQKEFSIKSFNWYTGINLADAIDKLPVIREAIKKLSPGARKTLSGARVILANSDHIKENLTLVDREIWLPINFEEDLDEIVESLEISAVCEESRKKVHAKRKELKEEFNLKQLGEFHDVIYDYGELSMRLAESGRQLNAMDEYYDRIYDYPELLGSLSKIRQALNSLSEDEKKLLNKARIAILHPDSRNRNIVTIGRYGTFWNQIDYEKSSEEIATDIRNGLPALKAITTIPTREQRYQDVLQLSSLTPAQARWLINDKVGPPRLNKLSTLTPSTAKELAKYQGWYFHLNGLKTLDSATAKELAKFKGDLYLNGLKTLDPATVKELAKFQGRSLHLRGLKELDSATAKELAKFQGRSLHLNSLKTLDPATVAELTKYKGELRLNGLKKLDPATAKELAKYKRGLSLKGLKKLDSATAKELAKFQGKYLSLDGLKELDSATAKELAKFQGRLSLNGLKKLDTTTAEKLEKFEEDKFKDEFKKDFPDINAERIADTVSSGLSYLRRTYKSLEIFEWRVRVEKYRKNRLIININFVLRPDAPHDSLPACWSVRKGNYTKRLRKRIKEYLDRTGLNIENITFKKPRNEEDRITQYIVIDFKKRKKKKRRKRI